jgi:hypothetical protein
MSTRVPGPTWPASRIAISAVSAVSPVIAVTHGGALGRCDDEFEFEFALDFILGGLERLLGYEPTPSPRRTAGRSQARKSSAGSGSRKKLD